MAERGRLEMSIPTELDHLRVDVGARRFEEHPVLVETSGGVFGATVTMPEAQPRAAMAILVGLSEDRSGANMMWRTLSHTVAGLGVATLRLDAPGVCDSHLSLEGEDGDLASLEVVRWFSDTLKNLPIIALGYCNGAATAVRMAVQDPPPLAVGLITPPGKLFAPIPLSGPQRLKAALNLHRKLSPEVGSPEETNELANLLDRTPLRSPTWILAGEKDRGCEKAKLLAQSGRHSNRLSVEIIEGMEVHWFSTPDVQREVMIRMVRWTEAVLNSVVQL